MRSAQRESFVQHSAMGLCDAFIPKANTACLTKTLWHKRPALRPGAARWDCGAVAMPLWCRGIRQADQAGRTSEAGGGGGGGTPLTMRNLAVGPAGTLAAHR